MASTTVVVPGGRGWGFFSSWVSGRLRSILALIAAIVLRVGILGSMRSEVVDFRTGDHEVVLDITGDCVAFVADERDGLLNLFVPHATAGIAIIETGAGSDRDLLAAFEELLPADDRWQHRHGSPGHGRSHVMPALVPPYATIPVLQGRLQLGTWQSICLVDLNIDNPDRMVRFSFVST